MSLTNILHGLSGIVNKVATAAGHPEIAGVAKGVGSVTGSSSDARLTLKHSLEAQYGKGAGDYSFYDGKPWPGQPSQAQMEYALSKARPDELQDLKAKWEGRYPYPPFEVAIQGLNPMAWCVWGGPDGKVGTGDAALMLSMSTLLKEYPTGDSPPIMPTTDGTTHQSVLDVVKGRLSGVITDVENVVKKDVGKGIADTEVAIGQKVGAPLLQASLKQTLMDYFPWIIAGAVTIVGLVVVLKGRK